MPDKAFPGIAEPRQSMVTAIRHAAQQGWFTAVEAEALIDRVLTPSRLGTEPTTRIERPGDHGHLSEVSQSRLATPHHQENDMTDVVFVSRYEKRVQFVQEVLRKNSKLSDKAAHHLAVEVVHAIDHIPEERR